MHTPRRGPVGLTVMILALSAPSCAPREAAPPPASTRPATQAAPAPPAGPNALRSLHLRLELNPATGDVTYFGAPDGRRNLLGPAGITTALVGTAPPELKGDLAKPAPTELLFHGTDQNQIAWTKRYRLQGDRALAVTHTIQNRGDHAFDAIVYSLADLPGATISGDNRDLHIRTPTVTAHFRADIRDPHFPGEQMNPSALRSDSKHLEPGDTMEFDMTWQIEEPRASRP